MKVLITGSSGMLGIDLVSELTLNHEVVGIANRENNKIQVPFYDLDIRDKVAVSEIIGQVKPDFIIHTAAHVNADDCEQNSEFAFAVNSEGTRWVAEASAAAGARMVFISTDYVFDGSKKGPYEETDEPHPLSVYGKTKVQAENFLRTMDRGDYIIRLSWLFGEHGPNFFKAILKKALRHEDLKVVDDQFGAPTYTKDLAKALRILVERAEKTHPKKGINIYHLANSGVTSWFDAARWILGKANADIRLDRITSDQLDRAAKRPKNSVLNLSKIKKDFGIQMRPWNEALEEYWNCSLSKDWERMMV